MQDAILDINYVAETVDTNVDYMETLYNINGSPAESPINKLILKNIDQYFECYKKFFCRLKKYQFKIEWMKEICGGKRVSCIR